jgi:hypothetical protein
MSLKIIGNTILLFSGALWLSACNPIKGKGELITHHTTVKGFNEISSVISGDVLVRQGDSFKVNIKGQENILPYVVAEAQGDRLSIHYKDKTFLGQHKKIQVFITMPSVQELELLGSGDIVLKGTFSGERNLIATVAGSGSINIEDYNSPQGRLEAKISGSGDVNLRKGQAAVENIEVLGSGSVNAASFGVRDANVSLSGSGNVKVKASNTLKAEIYGSGDVYYTGNPELHTQVSGSGKVHPL